MLESIRSRVLKADRAEVAEDQVKGLDAAGLLEAIVCETHAAALHTMVITSSINALRNPGFVKNLAALRNFLPNESGMIAGLLRSREEAGVDQDVAHAVMGFFTELGAVRQDADRFLAEASKPVGDTSARLGYTKVQTEWLHLSQVAIKMLTLIEQELLGRLPAFYADNSATLVKLLKQASSGQHPSFDAAGNVVLPDLPQRRRTVRRSLLQQCTLRYRGKTTPVIARDISATGLGLERIPDLKPDEVVQIELTGGRRLMGLVMWVRNGSAGIKLGRPLPPNDPLLIG
jgi:hypothetical protein